MVRRLGTVIVAVSTTDTLVEYYYTAPLPSAFAAKHILQDIAQNAPYLVVLVIRSYFPVRVSRD